MTTLSLDEVLAYARCPLEWFWERRAGLARPSTPDGLKTAALRQALVFYYEGHTDLLLKAMDWVWRDWCEAWGEPSIFDDLLVYAQTRRSLLRQIHHDKGRGASYAERMHRAGLAVLGRRLDEFAHAENRVFLANDEQLVGSALGDAFTDCRMAIEQARRFQEPLPARTEFLGLAVPYEIHLDGHRSLLADCDLAWRRSGDEPGDISFEVHDMQSGSYIRSRWAKHDLRVIAASLASPMAESSVSWERVRRVVYRHWPTGTCYVFTETNAGHLHAIAATVVRGLHAQALVPRALTNPAYCRACVYQQPCWEDGGWEKRHLVDPGAFAQADQIRQMSRRLRKAIDGDDVAAQRARDALAAVATTLEQSVGTDAGIAGATIEEALFAVGR
jgi:hypothetical protein